MRYGGLDDAAGLEVLLCEFLLIFGSAAYQIDPQRVSYSRVCSINNPFDHTHAAS
jgi:hypothetical protein